jgi:hypothetical protein
MPNQILGGHRFTAAARTPPALTRAAGRCTFIIENNIIEMSGTLPPRGAAARQPCELTRRPGRRASSGPCQLLRRVGRRISQAERSGAVPTIEIGAPANGISLCEPVLTPQHEDLHAGIRTRGHRSARNSTTTLGLDKLNRGCDLPTGTACALASLLVRW